MNTSRQMLTQAALMGIFASTQADKAIQIDTDLIQDWSYDDGYFQDQATGDDIHIGVHPNGVVYSRDSDMNSRIYASRPIPKSAVDASYLSFSHVMRLAGNPHHPDIEKQRGLLPEETFDELFPARNDIYTYDAFLRAAARFPKFCNDDEDGGSGSDEMCKRELATLFAHFVKETGTQDDVDGLEEWQKGLFHIHELNTNHEYRSDNPYWMDSYPMGAGQKYYGRGPLQLSWNYNFGEFSEMMDGDRYYDSKNYLLQNPDAIETDSVALWTSALWFYMTPQSPKPSMHEVVVGRFEPNTVDLANNMEHGFGATISIINGGIECPNHDNFCPNGDANKKTIGYDENGDRKYSWAELVDEHKAMTSNIFIEPWYSQLSSVDQHQVGYLQSVQGASGHRNTLTSTDCARIGNRDTAKALKRKSYYLKFLRYFGLVGETESLPDSENASCKDMDAGFTVGGAADIPMYFDPAGTNEPHRCFPVKYQTQYSVFTWDDYERCVCEKSGYGLQACPSA